MKDPIKEHQISVAEQSLRMTDAMLAVMGGPTKAEAKEILREAYEKDKGNSQGS